MENLFEPIDIQSLKDVCIRKLEHLILSGKLKIGDRLPAERILAKKFGISRPIIHEALVDLSIKGLVSILPRKGVYINDFCKTGSCALLSSLFNYKEGEFDDKFFQSLVDMRLLIELKTAYLASINRTKEHVKEFKNIIEKEKKTKINDYKSLTELDFSLHQLITIASGNLVFPLIINSFKDVYISVTGLFYKNFQNTDKIKFVLQKHEELVNAIIKKDENMAISIMRIILVEGEKDIKYLRRKL